MTLLCIQALYSFTNSPLSLLLSKKYGKKIKTNENRVTEIKIQDWKHKLKTCFFRFIKKLQETKLRGACGSPPTTLASSGEDYLNLQVYWKLIPIHLISCFTLTWSGQGLRHADYRAVKHNYETYSRIGLYEYYRNIQWYWAKGIL